LECPSLGRHWSVRVWGGIRKGAESATHVLCHTLTLALSREMESESEKLKANGVQCRAVLERQHISNTLATHWPAVSRSSRGVIISRKRDRGERDLLERPKLRPFPNFQICVKETTWIVFLRSHSTFAFYLRILPSHSTFAFYLRILPRHPFSVKSDLLLGLFFEVTETYLDILPSHAF
jgi:hypothetical protein